MGEGRGSTLVHLLVVILSLVAFGFAIAAERRRSIGMIHKVENSNATYCVYSSDVATGYAPGGNRAWTIIYFVSSWVTFLVAEACLVAGAKKNAVHTKYRDMIYAQNLSCEALRKGIFIAGAVFIVATMILNVYFYMYVTKATTQAAHKTKRSSSTVGMTGS
ncbi:hypothetical protein F0562_032741 [Nyssa sinensis]|uniref:Uncharacterized protein n=1 Tax=Nyssa sinensis TaxID=561372 RepID=A0A5J5AR48_9ASTE|nr:hypothetical protein F0562_032741 [Nyssa sinensis]